MVTLIQLYRWAKMTHRATMFGLVGLGIMMGITGLALKYVWLAQVLPGNFQLWRFLHNQLSPLFALFLTVMAVSGLYLYWYPWYSRRQARKKV